MAKDEKIASLSVQLKDAEARLAKERDRLRDIASEAETLADSCEEARSSLEYAIDTLSQYV